MPETQQSVLSFPFNSRKLAEALAFLASSNVPDLTKLKAVKLVYFADRLHLLRFGRPIVGGQYFCLDKGPVPSEALNALNAATANARDRVDQHRDELRDKVEMRRSAWQFHHRIHAKTKPDMDVFSDSEVQILKLVATEYGKLSAGKLIEISHEHEAWRDADKRRMPGSRAEMSYEMFFQDDPVDRPVREAASLEQEDRNLSDAMAAAAARHRKMSATR
jgi:uncharacterized phage-associated protein